MFSGTLIYNNEKSAPDPQVITTTSKKTPKRRNLCLQCGTACVKGLEVETRSYPLLTLGAGAPGLIMKDPDGTGLEICSG